MIDIFLTPCQFSTGQEKDVCLSFSNVNHVYSAKQTLLVFYSIGFKKEPGIVLYLGGDSIYPRWFARRTKSRLIGYSEHNYSHLIFILCIPNPTVMI